jgi:predicted PurR-regulated permease PerM
MATARTSLTWQRMGTSLVTLALVMVTTGFLYWARPVLVPIALAVLLAFLLSPLVTWLQRRKIPRVPAVFSVTIAAGVVVGLLSWIFTAQVVHLAEQLPAYQENVTKRIEEIRDQGQDSLFRKVQRFIDGVTLAATKPDRPPVAANGETPQPVVLVGTGDWSLTPLFSALGPVVEPMATAGLVIVLVIYILIERESVRDRLLRLVGQGHMTVTTKAMDDAGHRISRYLLAQFCLNAAFGVFIAGGLWFIGVPHALLWGFMSAFLRYIPFLGPWLAAILPVSLSLMTAPGWTQPVLVVMLFVAFELLSNLVVEPLVYGRSIGVSQSSLIVAIAFWAWLWGPLGLVLAAPLTVCLVILGKYVPALKFFDILLGDDPPLAGDIRFYQRLLAGDEDEASDVAREQLQKTSLEQVYDQLLMTTLSYGRRDLEADRLTDDEAEKVWQLTGEIGVELALARATLPATGIDISEDTGESLPRIRILACAARDQADEIAVQLFARLLDPRLVEVQVANTDWLASEILTQADELRPAIVCIVTLPPGGLAHTRLLCKRLRQHLPNLKIVVARWGLTADVEGNRKQIVDSGADFLGTTLEETTGQLIRLVQFLRPSADRPTPPPPHFDVQDVPVTATA